jgi:murein L,D-transpeptidase YafK
MEFVRLKLWRKHIHFLSFFIFISFSAFQATCNAADLNSPARPKLSTSEVDGEAEIRLIEIYKLIGQNKLHVALEKAKKLTKAIPNFQLAQLVYGDLLSAQMRPVKVMGDVPSEVLKNAGSTLNDLRLESAKRLKALQTPPPQGSIPSQFLTLSLRSKHAIAVDASQSRLYLFENTPDGLRLKTNYYISVGKAGISKNAEGDQRTPLGIYFITSNLDKKTLKEFYGSGALPINYPNVLDLKRGKTGGGIWLHGTPPYQFSRAPLATDGCVVLANPDLTQLIHTVEIRSTPVVIASQLQWVEPHTVRAESASFEETLKAWKNAKSSGLIEQITPFYTSDFNSNGKNLQQWIPTLRNEMSQLKGRTVQLKDVSFLRWVDSSDTIVATFGEIANGTKTGWTKRQYWTRQGNQWKIFFEGII